MGKIPAKSIYKMLFVFLAISLMLLPFANVLNHLLTRVVEGSGVYRLMETYIIPHLIKLVMVVLKFLGIKTKFGNTMLLVYQGQKPLSIFITWNCIGWQSLLLFLASLLTGLCGNYTLISKFECALFGLLGTFLLNLARIVSSVLAIIYVNKLFAYVMHDYLMILITIFWLFFFWWFSYSFVLEENSGSN